MIAICIGHSRRIGSRYDGGAWSDSLQINERDFNLKVADKLQKLLAEKKIASKIFSEYNGNGYGTAMFDVANKIRMARATFAIELHFNSSAPEANGHEWLYWHSSLLGKRIAQKFEDAFSKLFPNIKARGIKAIQKQDRGGKFLELTHCPAVILEPFFGSNVQDCSKINVERIAEAYAKAIDICINPAGHPQFKP
jgi:N-acetylmuramoyl-L-alanine amidase